ncbi:MAG: M48 family metalloprotease [Actinophytocola sp.]|uniref:M48 family metalloprotease n=1 Tax=Actinophytocola sp. TaxID=1872138 RepID=UPI0013281EA7|nr:M48 family metalloprotease [Actinophytocola sp.]MPZ83876.1 M48 family metalloprotease [Actinophytocola sp.]
MDDQARAANPVTRRRPDASSTLSLLLGLPAFLCSLAVVAAVGTYALPRAPWLIPVLWVLSGAVLFVPSVEPVVTRLLLKARRPSQAELDDLWQPWQAVCRVAGVAPDRFVLMVEDSDDLNAFAAGGRTVAVTRTALRLPPKHLDAVLAHELGHHLSGHPMVDVLSRWYALPARGAAFLAMLALRVILAVASAFARVGGSVSVVVALLLSLLVLTMLAFLSVWLLLVPLISPFLAWARRLGELSADRVAASLGYGPHLADVLHRWFSVSGQRPEGLRKGLLATHPSPATRIQRLHGLMR